MPTRPGSAAPAAPTKQERTVLGQAAAPEAPVKEERKFAVSQPATKRAASLPSEATAKRASTPRWRLAAASLARPGRAEKRRRGPEVKSEVKLEVKPEALAAPSTPVRVPPAVAPRAPVAVPTTRRQGQAEAFAPGASPRRAVKTSPRASPVARRRPRRQGAEEPGGGEEPAKAAEEAGAGGPTLAGSCGSTRHELHGFTQVRRCQPSALERARRLLHGFGWPGLNDEPSRQYISELLGLRRIEPRRTTRAGRRVAAKTTTYLGWAVCRGKTAMVAVAILSVYRYRDEKRRCGCLEFITSRSRGAGSELVVLAQRFLAGHGIRRLFSGADLSRPLALKAHKSWSFEAVEREEWGKAGLAFYGRGDVHYMVLDLPGASPAAAAEHAEEQSPTAGAMAEDGP